MSNPDEHSGRLISFASSEIISQCSDLSSGNGLHRCSIHQAANTEGVNDLLCYRSCYHCYTEGTFFSIHTAVTCKTFKATFWILCFADKMQTIFCSYVCTHGYLLLLPVPISNKILAVSLVRNPETIYRSYPPLWEMWIMQSIVPSATCISSFFPTSLWDGYLHFHYPKMTLMTFSADWSAWYGINPGWCRMWLTVFRRKAKAKSTYHLPRKSCFWLPVKYMNS